MIILNNWRSFLPAGIALLLGLIFLRLPALAVFFVSGALFTFGFAYGLIVYKIVKAKKSFNEHMAQQTRPDSDTSFRNVTVQIFRNGKWFDVNNNNH